MVLKIFSGLNDLNRYNNITSLNDLNSLFGLKKSKTAFSVHTEFFSWHKQPQRPQWPQQPQQPQWPQWPLQPHFLKKIIELDVSIKSGTKMTYPGLLMWDGSSILLIFGTQVCWRLWRTGMLLLTKLKGHKSNVRYLGIPNYLQTKSNLHISICQGKLKHKCLPLDTL